MIMIMIMIIFIFVVIDTFLAKKQLDTSFTNSRGTFTRENMVDLTCTYNVLLIVDCIYRVACLCRESLRVYNLVSF